MRKSTKILLTLSFLALGEKGVGSQLTDLAASSRPQASSAFDLSHAYAFPVPYKPSSGQPYISFINLSTDATVRIFDTNGTLVRTLHESSMGIIQWDVTDDEGRQLSSDVFFYLIENREQTKSGKLIVVR